MAGLGGVVTRFSLRRRHLEGLLVVAALGMVLAASAFVILHGAQLSWDEAVYASKARSLATLVPASNWELYRPPGLPYLGLLSAPFGFSEGGLRLVSAAVGVGALAAAWALARALWGAPAGVLTLLVLAAAPTVLREIAVYRNDIVSLAPPLLLLLLLWSQLERRAAPNALLLAAEPLAAASFYLRFGSLPLLGGISIAALLLWGGRLWRHRRLVGVTLLIAVVLFLPHVVEAVAKTGSPLGIVRSAVAVVDTSGPTASAVQYLRWLPLRIAGPLGIGFVIAAGVAAIATGWASINMGRLTPDARRLVLLLVPATVGAIGLILVSHPEVRYMLPAQVLAIVAGAGAVAEALRRLARGRNLGRTVRVAGTAAIVAGLISADAVVGLHWLSRQVGAARVQWLALAGTAIAADADGRCLAIATRVPIIGWYSRCLAVPFAGDLARTQARMTPGTPTYVVFASSDGDFAQPKTLERYRNLVAPPAIATIREGPRMVEVYRLPP